MISELLSQLSQILNIASGLIPTITNNPCGITSHYGKLRHISGHHTVHTNHSMIANGYAISYTRPSAYPDIFANHNAF